MSPSPATVMLSLLLAALIVGCLVIWTCCRLAGHDDAATERLVAEERNQREVRRG